ncbi:MAG: shikimate dehydrogenase [Candidatus Eremiobacteraeota bacterium]|nr:shikimate dehydrogenase [Candidatus Eremiobacteraeota bacterium]
MAERRFAAVIGHPIAHSLSPAIFRELAAAAGIALEYRALDVPQGELESTLVRFRNDPGFVGCNVTMPHKERIVALLDRCTPAAQACVAVNVVRREGTQLLGDNTDVAGIEATLRRLAFEPRGARAVIFGAGGGAHAVATVLGEAAASEVWIVTRSLERGRILAERATARWPATAFAVLALEREIPPPAELYVNATPLGQSGQPSRELLPRNAPARAYAFDLVYRPAQTPFVRDAGARGMRAIGGFPMLLEQALATFERWFGFRPPLDSLALSRLERLAA